MAELLKAIAKPGTVKLCVWEGAGGGGVRVSLNPKPYTLNCEVSKSEALKFLGSGGDNERNEG